MGGVVNDMIGNNLSRRDVLKWSSAGIVSTTLPAVTATAKENPDISQATRNKTIFVESGAEYEAPRSMKHARGPEAADLAIFSSRTKFSRGVLIRALKKGTSVGFVGEIPEEAFLGTLHDINPGHVRRNKGVGEVGKPDDLDFTFGLEYTGDGRSSLVIGVPNGSQLDTHNYRMDTATNNRITQKIDKTARHHQSNSVQSGCGDWICLGTTHSEDRIGKYGEYEKWVTGKKADGSDPSYDYVSFKTEQNITPGKVYEGNDWQNSYTKRKAQFPLGDELRKHGPNSTTGSTSTSVGVGLSADASGGSAGLNWSWTYDISNVVVENNSLGTQEEFNVKHDINLKTNPAKHTYKTFPGCQVRVEQGQSKATYIFDDEYKWVKPSRRSHTFHVDGDGDWVL